MEPLANLKIDSTSASVLMLQTCKKIAFLIVASNSTNFPLACLETHILLPYSTEMRVCMKNEVKKRCFKESYQDDREEMTMSEHSKQYEERKKIKG